MALFLVGEVRRLAEELTANAKSLRDVRHGGVQVSSVGAFSWIYDSFVSKASDSSAVPGRTRVAMVMTIAMMSVKALEALTTAGVVGDRLHDLLRKRPIVADPRRL